MKHSLRMLVLAILASISANAQEFAVTFQVDMTGTSVQANGPSVETNTQGSMLGVTPMTQVGATSIYQATINLPEGIYDYKFYSGDQVSSAENVPVANRYAGTVNRYSAVFSDTILPPFLFSGSAPAGKELLELAVDLYFVTPSELGVYVAGDFQSEAGISADWTPGKAFMLDYYQADADQIYSIQTWVTPGTYEYKFLNGNNWPQVESVPEACGVGANLNRQVTVNQGTPTEVIYCLSSCNTSCFSVSTNDLAENVFSLLPNPAETATQVVFGNTSAYYTVRLFDMTGRNVFHANKQQQSTIIERNGLPAGLYLLQLEDAKGNVQNAKLIFN